MQNDDGRRRRPTRRDILRSTSASAFALTTGLAFAQEPLQTASGHVFHDRSGIGRRRPGDPGIPGVMVSNGRDVVLTDSEGRWRLSVAEGDHVFVVKPPHWSTPVGKGGVPRFSYWHHSPGGPADVPRSPAGSTSWRDIDFPLQREEESGCFEVLLTADTQPANGAELAYLRDDIIAGTLGRGAAFGINHGDVVFDDLSLYPRYLEMLGASGIPWHHCPGNHDMDGDAADDRASRETWKRTFGPRHYAIQHAGATFIVLDNVYYCGHNPGAADSGQYRGLIGARQLEFVRNVLGNVPAEQLVVLSMHIPLVNYQDAGTLSDNTWDRRALLELLASRPHTVSFAGHMHLTEHHYLGADEGFRGAAPHHHHVLTAASGGWWGGPKDSRGIPCADSQDGTPNGFHVLAVDGSRYTTRFIPAAGKGTRQLRAVIEGPHNRGAAGLGNDCGAAVAESELEVCDLVVNVFDGGPATRVTCEIAGSSGPPVFLRHTAMLDPYVEALFARNAAEQKAWVRPVPSSHVWKAPLPRDLAPGAHCLTVKATDEYGRESAAYLVLEVKEPGTPSRA